VGEAGSTREGKDECICIFGGEDLTENTLCRRGGNVKIRVFYVTNFRNM
jgi:hypothetical protein